MVKISTRFQNWRDFSVCQNQQLMRDSTRTKTYKDFTLIINSKDMRIIFIGIHNKPHLVPLCSSTKSGKLINRVISKLPDNIKYEKSNLYDVDYYPVNGEAESLAFEWRDHFDPTNDDIIVLLGARVHSEFFFNYDNIIKLAHPSSMWSHKDMNGYVKNAVMKIIDSIKKI